MPPGQLGNSAAFAFPLEWAAKVEWAMFKRDSPQLGHATESPLRTSFSNLVPQSSQTYSKMGMLVLT
jgi:hypothetical protein